MVKAISTVEGNARLVTIALPGVPRDMDMWRRRCQEIIAQSQLQAVGGLSVWMDLPPEGSAQLEPQRWPCRLGFAVAGLTRPPEGWGLEDYRQLEVLELPHHDSAKYVGRTYGECSAEAAQRSWRIRPYWRIRFPLVATSDNHLLPGCMVGVFRES